MDRKKLLILIVIIVFGFILRLYRFDNPIADWHSWRQADTSSVSRNFVVGGFDIFHPTYDDLSNVPSGLDNPNGYRFVEFPIYNIFQAGLFSVFGYFTLEEWGRLVTIFSSLSSAVLIFLILKRHQNETAGLIGAFFFSVLPFSVFYGRTILPDSSTAAAVLAGIYFFDLWIGETTRSTVKNSSLKVKAISFFCLSLIFTAIAFLFKPFAIFFTLPMIYLAYNAFGKRIFINPYLWIFAIISLVPIAGWRIWMMQFPEGIPANAWLFNEGNIRFKGAYFYWVFAERIGKLILGYWGTSLLILGLLVKIKVKPLFVYSFLVSSIIYLVIVARGNVQHDYYQILILPTICIFLGLGGEFLINSAKNFSYKYTGLIVFSVVTVFTLLFSWYYIRDYFNVNRPSIILAGNEIDAITPKDALVIANYGGDTSFLYQTKRRGWASYTKSMPEMIEMGADYLVIADPVPADQNFGKDYKIIVSRPEFMIIDLRQKP